jgi:hypothetical protein
MEKKTRNALSLSDCAFVRCEHRVERKISIPAAISWAGLERMKRRSSRKPKPWPRPIAGGASGEKHGKELKSSKTSRQFARRLTLVVRFD